MSRNRTKGAGGIANQPPASAEVLSNGSNSADANYTLGLIDGTRWASIPNSLGAPTVVTSIKIPLSISGLLPASTRSVRAVIWPRSGGTIGTDPIAISATVLPVAILTVTPVEYSFAMASPVVPTSFAIGLEISGIIESGESVKWSASTGVDTLSVASPAAGVWSTVVGATARLLAYGYTA